MKFFIIIISWHQNISHYIYRLRREIVSGKELIAKNKAHEFLENTIDQIIDFHTQGASYEWNIKEIEESVSALANGKWQMANGSIEDKEKLKQEALDFVKEKYDEKEKELGEEQMRQLERIVLLRTVDELWMDHIEAMEYLRDSVRLRAYGQRDPLVECKIEGQKMFQQLTTAIEAQVANLIFKVSLMQQPKQVKAEERRPEIVDSHKHQSVINEPVHRDVEEKIGRNSPCPCGSGKKYKRCHGK